MPIVRITRGLAVAFAACTAISASGDADGKLIADDLAIWVPIVKASGATAN